MSVLEEILDRPIAFQRAFVRLGAGITGALMLSQAIYWSKRSTLGGGWFFKTQADWSEETGMTRTEVESARKSLKKLGIMEEVLAGVPAKVHFRVRFDVLKASLQVSCKLDCGKPANKVAGNLQTNTETTSETTHKSSFVPSASVGDATPSSDDVAFGRAWDAYPKRAGKNSRKSARRAWDARRKQGVTADEIHAGVLRYAAYIERTGKTRTEFVMMASTFFGPDLHYEGEYPLPVDGQPLQPQAKSATRTVIEELMQVANGTRSLGHE